MKPSFCSNTIWNNKLSKLVQEKIFQFDNPKSALDVYGTFATSYNNGDGKTLSYPLQYEINYSRIPSFTYIQEVLSKTEYVGVDIPVYYNYNEDSPRIMVVGIDPLRSGADFKNKNSIGTPYGFHSSQNIIY